MSNPSRSPRTARAISSLVAAALVFGGAVAHAAPAFADDLIPVPKTDYQLAAVSSEAGAYPAPPALDGTALGAFDGDFATQWTSHYQTPAPAPHWISIDLQRKISVKAVDYSAKQGQGVAAKNVQVFTTNDAVVAQSSPADGGWGAVAATATLHAPTADTEKQRVELATPVNARFVAFVILDSQVPSANGGGAGELEVLSDQAIPPISSDPDPETPVDETYDIANGGTTATVSSTFPQITGYKVGSATLGGQKSATNAWAVNGTTRTAVTTATPSATGVDYVSVLDGIDVTVHSRIRVTDSGTVEFEVTGLDGSATVTTLGLPDNAFLSVASTETGAVLDRTVVSPDSTKNADEHIAITGSTATGTKGAAYAFVGNSGLIGSMITNATTQASGGTASWNARLTSRVTNAAGGRAAEVGSSTWLIHPTTATDPRVTTFELPKVTVLLTGDRNSDGTVDWQDGGIRYREVDTPRLGADRVADRVVSRIPFNFASSATNYFDLVLDNTKRIANQTDGLGQWVLNKGFGSEGHDSSNTDYGDNFNERAGGVADLNHLVDEGKTLNADMSVHVNATEIYPQAKSFDPAILQGSAPYSPGWNWLDQSFYIDQQKDLGQGSVLNRFEQLKQQVPGLSGVYIDVYYSNGWVAEELANQLHGMGLEVATEWGDKFVDNTVWSHWPNDLAYGGSDNKGINSTMVRFIQNGQADIWNADNLLGQQILVDAEGWGGNSNWDGFIGNIWTKSLPTKFIQQFDLLKYTPNSSASLTNNVDITYSGSTRTIKMDGATVYTGTSSSASYLLPWQSLTSNAQAGSPVNADKMYYYQQSSGAKTFGLTSAFSGNTQFDVFPLTDQGRGAKAATVTASGGQLTLSGLSTNTAYVVVPVGGPVRAAVTYHDAGLDDPGFNSGSLGVWHPTGAVTLARTNVGSSKSQSRGDNIAVIGTGASSIGQHVTGLIPGQKYSFSAQVYIAPTALRDVAVSVTAGGDPITNTWNLSPSYNYMRADSKNGQYYQRGSVSFTAPASGEADVSISAGAGSAVVRIDNARIMKDTTTATAAGTVYSNDFEGNQPGWGPFVKGNASNIDDPRTSISRRHDPVTSKEWRNTAKPFNSGSLAGLAVDTTLNGEHSLMSHSENTGVVYRTDPTLVSLQAGHSYRIGFNYQVGASGSYRWLQGTDKVGSSKITSATVATAALPKALTTTPFTQDINAGCTDYTWVGLERIGGAEVDFVLDDFTVTDLGPTAGGAACATVAGTTPTLNPGAQAAFTTTFTNSENTAATNVNVQLDLPSGYTAQVADGSSNQFGSVAAGAGVQTKWLITAPTSAAGNAVNINAAAKYSLGCDIRNTTTQVQSSVSTRARIPNSQITATASTQETSGEDGKAANMLDGNPATFWHSRWSSSAAVYPHTMTFDLSKNETVDGISYLRRPANVNGPIKGYTVAVSTNGTTYTDVKSGEWTDSADWQDVNFPAVTARYIRVTATSSISGTQFAAVAEMAIYGTPAAQAGHAPEARGADASGCVAPRVAASANQRTVTLSASATGTQISKIEYSLGNGWMPYSQPFAVEGTGAVPVQYRATDGHNRDSAIGTINIAATDPGANAVLAPLGLTKTALVGEAVSGLGATITDEAGGSVLGVDVTFTVTGGTFAGGSTSAVAKTNAAGIAVAPAVSATAAGALVITATYGVQSVALPTVTIVQPATVLSADVTVVPGVSAGKVVLPVSVVNTSSEAVTIKVTTKYGTKTFASVAAGATVSTEFKTYLAAIPAGTVTVTLTGDSGVATITATHDAK